MVTSREERRLELLKLPQTREGNVQIRKRYEELTGERLGVVAFITSHLIPVILDHEFPLQTA
jgi:hypothetical protein